MKSQIYFKIKNEKNYDSIRFTGGSLSLKDLKTKIKEKLQDKNAGIGKEKDKDKAKDDILVIDELTKQLISDDSTPIASDRKVLIERSSALPVLSAAGYRSSYATGIKADKSEFMCPLCKNQFVNPTLTRCCGGTACETCIDKSVKQKNECPFCHKKALGSIKAGLNSKIQELIQRLPTSMPPSLPTAHGYGSQPMNPNVAMNGVPFKEIEKYLNGAKYFIIKSSNFENIQLSIKHSEWATTKANETKLNNAFQRSKNVILIFSVNKSSQFQGYARMESLSTNRAASWQVQDSIKLGGSFKILWLRVCNVNFSRVSQMKNKFNNGEPIKKSRDTQEIPEDIGFQICNMFELPDKDNTTMHYPTSSDRPKFMYQYGQAPSSMGYPNPEYTAASSPRDMREFKPLSSDTASPNDGKSPLSKLASDDFQSNIEREELYAEEEKKKDEPEIDLLADLDFDEPTVFEPAPAEPEKPAAEQVAERVELEDDFPLEHEVANIDDLAELTDAQIAPEIEEEQPEPETRVEENAAHSEARESIQQEQEQAQDQDQYHDHDQDDFLNNLESYEESDKIQEEESKEEYQHHQPTIREEERPQPPPPKMHYEEAKAEKKLPSSRSSRSSRSASAEKQAEEKKKPKPPAVDMHKFPPAPSMPYDTSMMTPGGYMPRPPPVMDHRPPPPNMYPSAPQSMRYQQQYGGYPGQYPNAPYGSYPMAPYPGMDQRIQMGMNPNYPYQYYGYPGMWGGQGGRPFPMDTRGKPDGNEDGDNQSEASEESDSSRKREKKKHKKEKKKKRSRDRSKDRSREREKSNVREKGRSRDRSREKVRNKSKSKSRRK